MRPRLTSPRTLVHEVRQLGTYRPLTRIQWARRQLQRPRKERFTTTSSRQFHCCTSSSSTDADLIAESVCLTRSGASDLFSQ
jgi:hypothetical protein